MTSLVSIECAFTGGDENVLISQLEESLIKNSTFGIEIDSKLITY